MQRPSRITLKKAIGVTLFVALGLAVSPFRIAANDGCQNASGRATWTMIPAPNDALGRYMGPNTGAMKGSATGLLTSLTPNPDGSLHATTSDSWVLGPQDILQFAGDATFTPIPGASVGTVDDARTLIVAGGTGKYAGATGTINVTGTGYNLFGPGAGAGHSFFDLRFDGTICTVN